MSAFSTTQQRQKQRGVSLIELMIALAISTLLMLGVFEVFIGSNANSRVADNLARIQESGRLALDILGRNLRMAGSQGEDGGDDPLSDGIQGFESGDDGWTTANRPDEIDAISSVPAGTDIIYIQYVDASSTDNAIAYYVKDSGRDKNNGGALFALYQYDAIAASEEELIEGVEQLQVLYGERLGSGNVRFVPADDATLDFDQVIAVRISLLVSGTDSLLREDDNSTYPLAGTDVEPFGTAGAEATHGVDRYLRRAFTSTVYLRNLD